MTAGPVHLCRVAGAWDGLAVVGGENYLTKHILVRQLTLWLSLASHKKVKHVLPLFQNAEVTFLRWGCCLFDIVTVLKSVLQMQGLVKQEPESCEVLALGSFIC